jgi:glycosyltransferase involved in cell wall biosynthesis
MNLLFLSIDQNLVNAESAVSKRVRHYGELAEKVDVILVGSSLVKQISLSANVTIHTVGGSSKPVQFFRSLRLSRSLVVPDTIISVQDPFEMGVWGLIASWLFNCRLQVQVHIDFFSPYFRRESMHQRFQAWLAPFVLRRASSIRVVSQKIATYLRDSLGIASSKIVIAPIFVDVAEMRNKPLTTDLHAKYPQFDWIVLVACRYVKQKNIPLAIEAFELFRKKHPKSGLIIAGSGPEGMKIKGSVVKLGLNDSVIVGSWTGEFTSLMRTSDVFLMPSDYEGWGMTVIEAASLGRPIVMTDVGCANEFLINEKSGLIVGTRDVESMTSALERLYENRAFATNLGLEAKRWADIYMTPKESDELMLELWKRAL